MAALATVLEVIESMGMDPGLEETLTPIISSAIAKATTRVAAELGTALEAGSAEEVFYLDTDLFSGITPNGLLSMRLRNLFLSGAPTLYYRESLADPYTLIDETTVFYDSELGVVKVPLDYSDMYVKVVYSYGFTTPTSVVPAVKQSILSIAPLIFRASQITTEAADAPRSNEALDLSKGLLGRYLRHPGFMYVCIHFLTL